MSATASIDPPHPEASPTVGATVRVLRPRRRVPSSRVVVGALLVTLAAAGALLLGTGSDASRTTPYVVVTRAVGPGSTLTAEMLGWRDLVLADDVEAQSYTDIDSLVGAVSLGPLAAGQLVQRAAIAPAASTAAGAVMGHEVTIPVGPTRVPPALRRGEPVAVLATYGSGGDARTVVATQRAVVLSVDASDGALTASRDTRLTISLADPLAVVEIVHASQAAELTVVRATRADDELPTVFSPTTTSTAAPKGPR